MREAREETGLDVELEHLVGVYCLRPERLGLRFVFKAHVSDGELLRFPTAEISEATWWPIDGLPANMTETAPHGIRDAADGKRGVTRDIWRERAPPAGSVGSLSQRQPHPDRDHRHPAGGAHSFQPSGAVVNHSRAVPAASAHRPSESSAIRTKRPPKNRSCKRYPPGRLVHKLRQDGGEEHD